MHRSLLPWLAAASCAVMPAVRAAATSNTYDYIVVGSGPGGGPLAANLARAGYSTLLIEAGDDQSENPTYSDMANRFKAVNDVKSRWDFWVKHFDDDALNREYDHITWDTGNGTFYVGKNPPPGAKYLGIQYPRAGVLGGCAMHNAGLSLMAQDDDWNVIVQRTGDRSWEANKMRKYFKQIERNMYLPPGNPDHGYDGWLATTIRDDSWTGAGDTPAVRMLKKFADLLNINSTNPSTLLDNDILGNPPNNDQTSNLYNQVVHMDTNGKRSSPSNYIRDTLADPANYPLTLKLQTLVTKVLFCDGRKPRATGVEVMEGASLYKADPRHVPGTKGPVKQYLARKEVIVAGGVFNSPQILKLSGIGPKDELKKLGIKVVKDLPGVGENMADNYEASLLGQSAVPVVGGASPATGIFRTSNAPTNKRNIFAWCGAFSFEGFWPGFPDNHGPNQFECALVHMGSKSQEGTVKLRSADPQDTPDINLRLFKKNGNADLSEMVDAIKLLRKTWQAAGDPVSPFQELHPCPGQVGQVTCSDASQAEFTKLQAWSHHATSTCAIGGDKDRMAVLDSKFRVRGVDGLRVVDGSAFPQVPGAFPVISTLMLSQKATEDILADASH